VGADPTWPNRACYSIPCDVTLGSGGGGGAGGTHSRFGGVRRQCCSRERLSGSYGSLLCFFSLFVSLLFLFPSVCCSVKLPLSRPTSFCLFLLILLRTPAGGGAAAWRRNQDSRGGLLWIWWCQSFLQVTSRLRVGLLSPRGHAHALQKILSCFSTPACYEPRLIR